MTTFLVEDDGSSPSERTNIAGWRRGQSRHSHKVKIAGSNPAPATIDYNHLGFVLVTLYQKQDRSSIFGKEVLKHK